LEEIELDAQGLDCPLPLLKAKQVLNRLPAGAKLRVLATDPGSQRDFAAFCRIAGHQLLESAEQDGVYRYLLLKGGDQPHS
jgi:TusA-related sulfurtransferase